MTFTLKINARNDIHLPSDALRALNLGEDRILKITIKENCVTLIPVDLEPRYSKEELEAMDRLFERESKKGLIYLRSHKDIENLGK